MISIAKLAVTKDYKEKSNKILINDNSSNAIFGLESGRSSIDGKTQVQGPSLLIMSCNLTETLRLREEIIHKVHECDLLSIIYKR